jgi:hypothetical protein
MTCPARPGVPDGAVCPRPCGTTGARPAVTAGRRQLIHDSGKPSDPPDSATGTRPGRLRCPWRALLAARHAGPAAVARPARDSQQAGTSSRPRAGRSRAAPKLSTCRVGAGDTGRAMSRPAKSSAWIRSASATACGSYYRYDTSAAGRRTRRPSASSMLTMSNSFVPGAHGNSGRPAPGGGVDVGADRGVGADRDPVGRDGVDRRADREFLNAVRGRRPGSRRDPVCRRGRRPRRGRGSGRSRRGVAQPGPPAGCGDNACPLVRAVGGQGEQAAAGVVADPLIHLRAADKREPQVRVADRVGHQPYCCQTAPPSRGESPAGAGPIALARDGRCGERERGGLGPEG